MEVTDEVLAAARIIWDFHQLRHKPIPADVIIALGTNDLRVAELVGSKVGQALPPAIAMGERYRVWK